jgi:hypothetical protein
MDNKSANLGARTAAVIAVALIGTAAVIGIYFLPQGSGNGDDAFHDPLIQGAYGLGTKFTYDSIGNNGYVVSPAGYVAEIVGQSGSYYMVEIKRNSQYNDLLFFNLVMIHKRTGELRFSSDDGKEAVYHEGKNVSLKKWKYEEKGKWSDTMGSGGALYMGIVISSNSEDGVPYKIRITIEYENRPETNNDIDLLLSENGISPEEPKQYTPSEELGRGQLYSVGGTSPTFRNVITSETAYLCAAEGDDVFFLMIWGRSVMGTSAHYTKLPGDMTVSKYLSSSNLSGSMNKTDPKIISTIDGKVLCDVYTNEEVEAYIGQENGILYLSKIKTGDGKATAELALKRYISR